MEKQIITIDLRSPLFAAINITVPCKCCHDFPDGVDLPINRESMTSAHELHGLVQSALIEALKKSVIPAEFVPVHAEDGMVSHSKNEE